MHVDLEYALQVLRGSRVYYAPRPFRRPAAAVVLAQQAVSAQIGDGRIIDFCSRGIIWRRGRCGPLLCGTQALDVFQQAALGAHDAGAVCAQSVLLPLEKPLYIGRKECVTHE